MPTGEVVEYQLTAVGLSAEQRRRAVLAVAAGAGDAEECTRLLDMLGLSADEARPEVPRPRG
jgi:hypothetical protein